MKLDHHIVGERVVISTFEDRDITEAYIGWLNDPEVVRFSNQRFRVHTRETCGAYLASFAGTPNLFLSIRRRSDEAVIGTMTVYHSLPHGVADVGVMIGERSVWGGGYGQDAWNSLLDWLLTQPELRKVTAGALAGNRGMVRLMERSGMSLEGVRRAQEIVDGKPDDILLYARFAE